MPMYNVTCEQAAAIKTKIIFLIGRDNYDELFSGMSCGHIISNVAHVYVLTEYHASRIDEAYRLQIAYAFEKVLGRRVRVNVLPKNFSDRRPASMP
jgi:hypothetical protein